MKRRHIAVITLLGNGHVNPVLPLCSELVERGHHLTYITSDHFADRIHETGTEPVIFTPPSPSEDLKREAQKLYRLGCNDIEYWQAARLLQRHHFNVVENMLSNTAPFYTRTPPDLILYDVFEFGGRVLAQRLGCSVVSISAFFAQYRDYAVRDNGIFKTPMGVSEYRADLDEFLSSHGIFTANNMWYAEKLNIHLIPRAFQYCNDVYDDRFCFTGALLNRPFRNVWSDDDVKHTPTILISDLSGLRDSVVNANRLYEVIIKSLADSQYNCILSIGEHANAQALGPLPKNFRINRSASHLEILPKTTLTICHGGMLTTLESIYHGVPVLAVPSHPEAGVVAYRTEELGAGRRIPRDQLTTDLVKDVVEEMLGDKGLFTRTREVQRIFKQSTGGAALVADQVEGALANR